MSKFAVVCLTLVAAAVVAVVGFFLLRKSTGMKNLRISFTEDGNVVDKAALKAAYNTQRVAALKTKIEKLSK